MENNLTILLGFKESKGEYEGRPYHNLSLYYSEPFAENSSVVVGGACACIAKIKIDNVNEAFGCVVTRDFLNNALNKPIVFGFNKFGQCNYVRVTSDKK